MTQLGRSRPPGVVRTAGRVSRILISTLAFMAILAPSAQAGRKGEFHVSCDFSHARADDPIVYPRQPGVSHLHTFFGSTSTDASSTYRRMRRSGTTCSFSADTSGYWIPALVSPSGQAVNPRSMTAYYLGQGSVAAPPADLRMLAGGDTRNLSIAGYTCGGGGATSSTPPNCRRDYVKAVISFPSCWDGRRTDSPDHRSHMAYPSGRGCPRGFPVRLPKIVFHITFGIRDGRGYTLSSDPMMQMHDGMSLHADFWNTWDQAELERQIDACLNAGRSCDLEDR